MDTSVILGLNATTGQPVTLGAEERQQGLYIPGNTGTGKTTLLLNLIVDDMEAGHSLCVLDPHGDLLEDVLARVPAKREQDVILLDVADSDYPFGLNLYECPDPKDQATAARIADQSVEVFKKIWGDTSWGPRLQDLLGNLAFTLLENPGCTMSEIPLLLTEERVRDRLVANVKNPVVRQFWENDYPKVAREQRELYESTLNKVRAFLRNPVLYHIVGQTKTSVDFGDVMALGKIVLGKLALGRVGDGVVSLLGSILVGKLLNAALSRQDIPPQMRHQFHLYADEYHRFAIRDFAVLLAEARKFNVSTTICHQFLDQLDRENRGAVLAVPNMVVFGVSGPVAEVLAKGFDATPPPPAVIGQRPKQTICQDPLGHLIRHGHEQEKVRALVAKHLTPLVHLLEGLRPGDHVCYDEGTYYTISAQETSTDLLLRDIRRIETHALPVIDARYYTTEATLRQGVHLINSYLIHVMEKRVEPYSDAWFVQPLAAIIELRGILAIAKDEYPLPGSSHPVFWQREPLPERTRNAVSLYIKTLLTKERSAAKTDSKPLVLARERAWHREIHAQKARGIPAGSWPNESETATRLATQEAQRFLEFFRALHAIAIALRQVPILLDSGQYEPIYDRPRTYADVQNEIATTLVILKPYHARCRLRQGNQLVEYTIKTFPPTPISDPQEAAARVERIRAQSRGKYCRPRDEVEREIDQRHRRLREGDEPPQTRRRVQI